MIIGFPPVFTSFIILLLRPIAAIAKVIMNLLSSLRGVKLDDGTPALVHIVVIIAVPIKNKIKNGKIFFIFTDLLSSLSFLTFLVLNRARVKVIGIIARVRVNFTVTALSRVSVPSPNRLSQEEAAAVTEEVSFIAVPAKSPNSFPLVVENPKDCPRTGKSIAAIILKKKIMEIAWATSSSSASITGDVAAMADPPHIEEPTPTSVDILPEVFKVL